jgi:hypothetical protein
MLGMGIRQLTMSQSPWQEAAAQQCDEKCTHCREVQQVGVVQAQVADDKHELKRQLLILYQSIPIPIRIISPDPYSTRSPRTLPICGRPHDDAGLAAVKSWG